MDAREQEFLEYVQDGGLVETDDWMPDEYRARLIKFIEMHGNSELMGVLPERDWILARADAAAEARADGEDPGRGRPLPADLPRRRGPRQAARALPRRPDLRQVEVPQRLPLPDEELGRRRRDRVARRRGRDHQPEGAPQVLLRAVRARDEEGLLGGVVPHPPRPRHRARDGDRHRRAVRARAGGAQPLVGAADALPRRRRSPPRRIRW